MKTAYSVFAIALSFGALSAPLYAGMDDMPGMKDQPMGGMGMGDMKDQKMSGMEDQMAMTHRGQGTVDKVDAQAGKVKISHGPIQSLNWKAMTMVFPVKDASLLQGIEPGMKVDFELEKIDGKYRVVSITPSN
ncbi:MAG: copper-binding protein [Gammaproteobacteria bacterium]|nr:copper-binding protein [Gammaproteobacteria bacterium]